MKRRMLILTELIAPYRIPVFNALAKRSEIELNVIFLSRTDTSIRQWRVYEEEIRFSYEVLPCWRKRVGKYNVLLNRGLTGALEAASPDVIVCGGYNYVSSWQALRWAKRKHVPFLLWSESTARDHRKRISVIEAVKRKFVENCDAFVVPGKSARDYLIGFGMNSQKVFTAPNAVDTALFSRLRTLEAQTGSRLRARFGLPERYFLFVGRLVREKGVLDLLNAYQVLPDTLRAEVGLVLAGDGPMRSELETLAREIYPGSVQLPGFVHRENLPAYYTLAECFVLPTHTDPWGLVVNEAMACGLPVICTRVAGCAADLVCANGRSIAPGDIGELAHAMLELAANAALRNAMAAQSRDLIETYSPETWAAGMAQAASAPEAYVQ